MTIYKGRQHDEEKSVSCLCTAIHLHDDILYMSVAIVSVSLVMFTRSPPVMRSVGIRSSATS